MAKSDNKPQEIPGLSTPTTQESPAVGGTLPLGQAGPPRTTLTEGELAARAKAQDEREKALLERERAADSKDAQRLTRPEVPATKPVPAVPDNTESVAVVNNGRRAIGVPGGFVLYPGLNTVPRFAWARMFGPDGKPTPGASEHLDPLNGQRPEVQEVSLRNLTQLPDEHAAAAINASGDETRLGLYEQTEARDSVRALISERLKVLRAQKEAKQ